MSEDSTKYEVLYNHNTLLETRQFDNKSESIYTITVVPEKCGERCRCIGFYMRYSSALHFIEKNGINGLDEGGLYKYLVIEKLLEGIYGVSNEFEETWFETDFETMKWKEIKKPKTLKASLILELDNMAKYENFIVTKQFLDNNPNAIFVFGDNLLRVGYGGAAILRDHPQTYGFITKKKSR